jgi:hypothetical protein
MEEAGVRKSVLTEFEAEMLERSAPKVKRFSRSSTVPTFRTRAPRGQ